jgi:exosortase
MPSAEEPGAGAQETGSGEHQAERPRLTQALTAVAVGLLVLCFAHYLGWMWRIWLRSDYYGHGPLIPVIAGYLVYTRRRELAQAAETGHMWGVPFIAGGLLVQTAAMYQDVNFPQGFALIAVVFGLTVLLRGWDAARVVSFPIAFLAFMVPMGRILVNQLSLPLQLGSTKLAVLVPMLMGVPVEVRGTTIDIPEYTFEVAEACSGLKSSIAMSALAALFAYLIVAPPWKRVVVFVAGLPVALLANAGRITLTLMLAKSFGAEAAEGFFHSFSGVLVFVLGLTGLFLVSKGLGCDRMREGIF